MENQAPRGVLIADNITVVTALLTDVNIVVDRVAVEDVRTKDPRYAHCVWHLASDVYTGDELSYIEQSIRACGDPDEFSYLCSQCGLEWMEVGGCGPMCDGEMPSFFTYDSTKRDVISGKRDAQEQLATAKGIAKLYRDR